MMIRPLKKPKDDNEMTFWDHLDELRATLWHIIIAILITSILAFTFKEILFDRIILAPKSPDFITYRILCKIGAWLSLQSLCITPEKFELININLAGQFTSHMNISLIAGLILAIPYALWELWRFIKPGLTPDEVMAARGGVVVTSILFLTGVLFSYFVVAPLMINFLGGYMVSASVSNQIALTSYVSAITMMTLLMGLLFELPVLVLFLTRIGILTPSFLRKYRKHTAIAILIISGIITPSPDIFSQLIVAVPLYALFEVSVAISSRIHKNKTLPAG
ncbi:MAG: twin-arginine translocase subunit TatC [Bacteroidales bacterium]|nr:twin-arginine translocase subunit TatC [Bacteroidales bacterium]HNW72533.1 twin-arginine translocase subunit TatC [Bacteroidales bacterium]HPS49968.1 twin-arginine translocase subunit TatC [Bacteroidales bacterium]